MPEMDGVEFLRKLVERRYAGSVILASGEDEQIQQSAETLVRAHQAKPMAGPDVAAWMQGWAARVRSGV